MTLIGGTCFEGGKSVRESPRGEGGRPLERNFNDLTGTALSVTAVDQEFRAKGPEEKPVTTRVAKRSFVWNWSHTG